MNIRIEKTDNKNIEALTFIALERMKLFLELNPKYREIYEGDFKGILTSIRINDFIEEQIKNDSIIYCAYFDDELIGAIQIRGNYISNFYVAEKYRNNLVGTRLLERLMKDCSDLKVIRVEARVTAISLYERFSFCKADGPSNIAFVPMELERGKYGK